MPLRAWRFPLRRVEILASLAMFWCLAVRADPPAAADSSAGSRPDATLAAHEVFSDSDFWWKRTERVESPGLLGSWFDKVLTAIKDLIATILQAIWDLVKKILESLFGLATGDWSSGSPIVWLVVALLVAWSLWKLYPLILGWLRSNRAGLAVKEPFAYQQLPEAGALLNAAAKAFQEGRYAEAIRLGLLALIARLQHQGLLHYDPAQTNREYQFALRPVPQLAAVFAEVARSYERVWYGRLPTTREEAERVLGACRPVVTEEERGE